MNNLNVKEYLIAGGNRTALVQDAEVSEYVEVATSLVGEEIEQVGFVEKPKMHQSMVEFYEPEYERLVMMGGELCVNATLAYARSKAVANGNIQILDGQKVWFENDSEQTRIEINLPYTQRYANYNDCDVILFESIGYEIGMTVSEAKRRKDQLSKNCIKFNLPAFGFIAKDRDRIRPLVYVAATRSMVWETSCGSGTIAYCIAKGAKKDVKQPTGESISVKQVGRSSLFIVSASVVEV